jgi:hypothetical protein
MDPRTGLDNVEKRNVLTLPGVESRRGYNIHDDQLFILSYTNIKSTLSARSKARTVFVRSKARIAGSNPTQGINVCVRLFSVCVVCADIDLATG